MKEGKREGVIIRGGIKDPGKGGDLSFFSSTSEGVALEEEGKDQIVALAGERGGLCRKVLSTMNREGGLRNTQGRKQRNGEKRHSTMNGESTLCFPEK